MWETAFSEFFKFFSYSFEILIARVIWFLMRKIQQEDNEVERKKRQLAYFNKVFQSSNISLSVQPHVSDRSRDAENANMK